MEEEKWYINTGSFRFYCIVQHKLPAVQMLLNSLLSRLKLDVLSLCAGKCLYQLFLFAGHSGDLVLVNQEVVIVNVSKHRDCCSAAYKAFGQ